VQGAAPIQASPTRVADLIAAFETKRATIGVIGLGYVGVPLALTAAQAGFPVLGFDVNKPRVAKINRGESVIKHIPAEAMAAAIGQRLSATADFSRLAEADAILICVPTPLTRYREPDLSYVVNTAKAIAPRLQPGQLVVLESTTYPGTTVEVVRPILETSGLKSGDFFLAYSPEREDPGNQRFRTSRSPRWSAGTESMLSLWHRPSTLSWW